MIEFKGHKIKSTIDELVMADFDKMNHIMSDVSLERFEKWIELYHYFGVPYEVFDEVELHELINLVDEWNSSFKIGDRVFSYELDGFVYEANELISVTDLAAIEKAWKKDIGHFGSECVAILFKRSDLSRTEHTDKTHLKHKTKLFSLMPCVIGVPHVVHALDQIAKNLKDATTTDIVEGGDAPTME